MQNLEDLTKEEVVVSQEDEEARRKELEERLSTPRGGRELTVDELRIKEEVAQFKLSLISPVIHGTYPARSEAAYLQTVSEKYHELPDGRRKKYSLKTLQRWVRNYRKEQEKPDGFGKAALSHKTRKDKGVTRSLDLEVMMRITILLQIDAKAYCTNIYDKLVDERLIDIGDVSISTIRRFIKAYDLRDPKVVEERIRRSFVVAEFNMLWEADTCYLIKLPLGKSEKEWVYVQGIIDNHSRLILGYYCYLADNSDNFALSLKKVVFRYGIPSVIYTDNGNVYTSHYILSVCNKLGITLVNTRAYDGSAKGACERPWRDLENYVRSNAAWDEIDTVEGIEKLVDKFIDKHNTRLNKGVNGIPVDRYRDSIARHPVRLPKSEAWLKECFMYEDRCHVYEDNVVQVKTKRYSIPDEIALKVPKRKGKTLAVRYIPFDVENTIVAVFKEQEYRLYPEDKAANANGRRNTGGRKTQLKEQAEEKRRKAMKPEERRAEERYRNYYGTNDVEPIPEAELFAAEVGLILEGDEVEQSYSGGLTLNYEDLF